MELKHIKQFGAFYVSAIIVLFAWSIIVNPISYLSLAIFPVLIGMLGMAGMGIADRK
jgi:hypothetical protein